MSLLQISFTSERDSPNHPRRSLDEELRQLQANFHGSQTNLPNQLQTSNDDSFISATHPPFLQNQPHFQQPSQQSQPAHEQESKPEVSPLTQPVTLIASQLLHGINSTASTLHTQHLKNITNQSLATFLSVRESNYEPMVRNFWVLAENLQAIFGGRLQQNKATYLAFLKAKHAQERAFCGVKVGGALQVGKELLFVGSKLALGELKNKMEKERNRRELLLQNIENAKNILQDHLQAVQIGLKQRYEQIRQLYGQLTEVDEQMTDLITLSSQDSKNYHNLNTEILKSKYLLSRYLADRERTYLKLIPLFLQKVLSFTSYLVLEVQPQTCLTTKQALMCLGQAYEAFYRNSNPILEEQLRILQKTNCFMEVYAEVPKLLELCIPSSLGVRVDCGQSNQAYLKGTVQKLIDEVQSVVYMNVIEVDQQDYIYHSRHKARVQWTPAQANAQDAMKQAYIIITKQGRLVIELAGQEQQMAVLKLSTLKMSKKNNQVLLYDRSKGVMSYVIGSQGLLGSLAFGCLVEGAQQNEDSLIEEFVSRAKQILAEKNSTLPSAMK